MTGPTRCRVLRFPCSALDSTRTSSSPRRGDEDVLVESNAEHGNLNTLHRVGPVINHGESSADHGFPVAENAVQNAILYRGIPGQREPRSDIAPIGVIHR